jgi:hypothetical protein
MPGAFGSDSPEISPIAPSQKKSRGLFSGLTRRLGIDSQDAQQQLQNFFTGTSTPEPAIHREHEANPPLSYYDETSHGLKPNGGGQQGGGSATGGEIEKVTSPHALHQNLLNAIRSSRPHDSGTLFSPPATTTVKETASYCDPRPAHNIIHIGDAANGTRIFISRDVNVDAGKFLAENVGDINAFANLLQEVAEVYGLPRKSMHVFYDEVGSTIAFNSGGAIFCNLRFFIQLHARKIEAGKTGGGNGVEGKVEAASWWWIVVAHELAHNLVAEHSAEHSYYTSVPLGSPLHLFRPPFFSPLYI